MLKRHNWHVQQVGGAVIAAVDKVHRGDIRHHNIGFMDHMGGRSAQYRQILAFESLIEQTFLL